MISSQSFFFLLFFSLLTFECTASESLESTEENSTTEEEEFSENELKWNNYFNSLVNTIVSKSCCCPTCNKYLDNGKQKFVISEISTVLRDHTNQLLEFRFWPLFHDIFPDNKIFFTRYENCLRKITEHFVHYFVTKHTSIMKKEVQNAFGNYLVDGIMKIPDKEETEKYEQYKAKHFIFMISNKATTTRLLRKTFLEINRYVTEIVAQLKQAQKTGILNYENVTESKITKNKSI